MTEHTFSIHDCAEAFRANGISISEPKLKEMILAGRFPFAFGVSGKETTYLIFKGKFYKWLEDMTGEEITKLWEG